MKVFISWSGPKSQAIAEAIRDLLQDVIQALEPWMSSSDIEKGARWRSEISRELEESKVGIICLTHKSMESSWLLFEAGALSKMKLESQVCTLLVDLQPSEVREPLAQFQSTKCEREEILTLLKSINDRLEDKALPEKNLERTFERAWPDFASKLASIKGKQEVESSRDFSDSIDEILGHVRNFSREQAESLSLPDKPILGLSSDEIITLGRILSANRRLNVVSVDPVQIHFVDGEHGTRYRTNRRALKTFLKRTRELILEEKADGLLGD